MLQIGLLNLRPFHVHAAILLSILEISQDIRIFFGTQHLNRHAYISYAGIIFGIANRWLKESGIIPE